MIFNKLASRDLAIIGTVLAAALFLQTNYASAIVDLRWTAGPPAEYTLNDGDTPVNPFDPVLFNVTDTSAVNGAIDKIPVIVESISPTGIIKDRINMTLYEVDDPTLPAPFRTPTDSGMFGDTDLVFNPDTPRVSIGRTATVTQQDASKAGNGILDTITLQVNSTTNTPGIPLTMTETGPNTGIFTGKLTFTSSLSVPNEAIQVSPGDIVSINYLGNFENMAVTPSPDGSVGGILADVGDTIRISYQGHTADAIICACGGPGGGGGGLIRPGLVLDAILVGGSPFIVSPPSFGGTYYHYSDGLTLTLGTGKSIIDTSKYNQEILKQVMVAEQKVNMTFKTFESYNPTAVVHMGLYIIPRGEDMITSNSIGSIVWEKGKPVEVNDPSHILSDAAASSTDDGKFQYTKFSFVPEKSYDKMSFLIRAWNDHRYSTDIRVHDAIDTAPPIKTIPAGVAQYDNFANLQAALEKDQFYKPQLMAHIHDTNAIFGSSDGGQVYWLYDTINHTVTLVIADKNDNEISSSKASLQPYVIEKKGDYKFMHFTVQQLNRWNDQQLQNAMKFEAAKAMLSALEKGIMPHRNW